MKCRLKCFIAVLLSSVLLTGGCVKKQDTVVSPASFGSNPQKETIYLNVVLSNQWKGVFSPKEDGADYDSFLTYAAEKFLNQYGRSDVAVRITALKSIDVDAEIRERRDTSDAVDVLFAGTFSSSDYAHMGWLLPLDDVIDESSRKDIPQSIWKECIMGGKRYFYPYYMLPNTLVYNAELFRQAGLDEFIGDKDEICTWSVSEFERILKGLHNKLPKDCSPLMMYAKNEQGDSHTMALLRARGTPMVEKIGIDLFNDEGIAGFQWIKRCSDRGYFPKDADQLSFADNRKLFLEGRLAIIAANPVSYANYTDRMEDVRLANFPSVNGGLQTVFIQAGMAFDNGDTDKEQIAKDFVAFFNSDPELVLASENGVPVRETVLAQTSTQAPFDCSYSSNESEIISISDNLPNWMEFRQYYFLSLQALLQGEKTPHETAMYLQEKGNAVIMEGKVKSEILK